MMDSIPIVAITGQVQGFTQSSNRLIEAPAFRESSRQGIEETRYFPVRQLTGARRRLNA